MIRSRPALAEFFARRARDRRCALLALAAARERRAGSRERRRRRRPRAARRARTSLGALAAATPLSLTVVLAPARPGRARRARHRRLDARLAAVPPLPQRRRVRRALRRTDRDSVAAVAQHLRSDGLTPGTRSPPNGLSIAVSGSAARRLARLRRQPASLPRARRAPGLRQHGRAARAGGASAASSTTVLGLDNLPAAAPAGLRRAASKPAAHAASAPLFADGRRESVHGRDD